MAGNARLAKSIDGGATWTRADTGLPDVQTSRVVVDPRDATNNTLYLASDLGVFQSGNGGLSWTACGTGLPNVRVSDLYLPPDGSSILASTYGRGVWTIPSLSYVSSSLIDDVNSCDQDGALDNGETGHLTITLHNGGSAPLSVITATVTSSNPNVSFPNGNLVSFLAAGAGADTTAAL